MRDLHVVGDGLGRHRLKYLWPAQLETVARAGNNVFP
jgi:hypothetical protein